MNKISLWDWILMNAEGGSGSGSEGNDGSQGGGEGGGESGAEGGSDGGADSGAEGGSEGGDGGSAAGYRPEGLPDHLFGTSDQDTMDKMAKALDGYRKKDSESGVPDNQAAYAAFGDAVPDELKSHVAALAEDTVFQNLSKSALEKGLSVEAFQGLTVDFFKTAQDMGLLEPVIDEAAEKAALVPESAKHLSEAEQKTAREQRMNDNFAFLDTLTAQKEGADGMAVDVADYAKAMLGDSAKGHQFIEHMRSQISGGPAPYAGGDKGGSPLDAHAALQARVRETKNNPEHRDFDAKSYEKLKADLQAYHGANPT